MRNNREWAYFMFLLRDVYCQLEHVKTVRLKASDSHGAASSLLHTLIDSLETIPLVVDHPEWQRYIRAVSIETNIRLPITQRVGT